MQIQSGTLRNSRGFSIVEVLVATSIASILLLAITSTLTAVQRSSMTSETRAAKTIAIEALRMQLMHKQICMKSFLALPRQFKNPAEVAIKLGSAESLGTKDQPINNTVKARTNLPLYSFIYTESLQLSNWQEVDKPSGSKAVYSSDLNWTLLSKKLDSNNAIARHQMQPAFVGRVLFEVENGAITSCYLMNTGTATDGNDGSKGGDGTSDGATLCKSIGGVMKDGKCVVETAAVSKGCYNLSKGQPPSCKRLLPKPVNGKDIPPSERSKYNWVCGYPLNGSFQMEPAKWEGGRWAVQNDQYDQGFKDQLANGPTPDCATHYQLMDGSKDTIDSGTTCYGSGGTSTCVDGAWITVPNAPAGGQETPVNGSANG